MYNTSSIDYLLALTLFSENNLFEHNYSFWSSTGRQETWREAVNKIEYGPICGGTYYRELINAWKMNINKQSDGSLPWQIGSATCVIINSSSKV